MIEEKLQINSNNSEDVLCEGCGGGHFEQAFIIKKISALISPTGNETFVPIQLFRCSECKHVNKDFN